MMTFLAEGSAVARTLPMPPAAFALVAIAAFALLLAVTYAFRGISNRH
jgi:hypothetical protein